MPAYEDKRDGRWRYRKRVDLPDGRRIRITGTPATDTKKAAEAAERAHIERVLHPERVRAQALAVPERKETTTFREFAKRFMAGYLPGQKPSERKAKNQILNTHLLPFFGHMALDEIRQEHVDAFTTAELKRCAQDGEQPACGAEHAARLRRGEQGDRPGHLALPRAWPQSGGRADPGRRGR
jgi:hypothetical protein